MALEKFYYWNVGIIRGVSHNHILPFSNFPFQNYATKFLYVVFSHFFFLYSLFSIAQTDTLSPIKDTLTAPSPFIDTLTIPDTLTNPAFDTSMLNIVPDTILPIIDTLIANKDTLPTLDTIPKPVPPKKIIAQFDTNNLVIQQGEIISKLLQVINGTEKQFTFTINLTYPGGWNQLTNSDKQYILDPGDTFFIPARIVPLGKIQGNTKYLIFAYIINENRVPVASAHFLAEKKKIVNWTIDISPESKIYLLNDKPTTSFSVNIMNTGNEQEELTLDMSNFRQDRIALMDTNDRILTQPLYTFSLLQLEDTNFYFHVRYTQGLRNYRMIDHFSYNPNFKGGEQKYSIFAQSRQSAITGAGSIFKGKKIDIIRLNDEHKVNLYRQAVAPLTMEANISNILIGQPILNLLFNGSTILRNGANLTYSFGSYFSSYYANYRFLPEGFFNIGYSERKFNIQLSNVSRGLGISGNYFINQRHTVGAYYSRGPLINPVATNSGLNYGFSLMKFRYSTQISRNSNLNNIFINDYFRNNFSFILNSQHSVNMGVFLSQYISNDPANPFTKSGYMLNGGYSGMFFRNKLQTSLYGSYSSLNYGGWGQGILWNLGQSSGFSMKKWNLTMNNSYQRQEIFTPSLLEQTTINNAATITRKINKSNISPVLFYNIINYDYRPSGGQLSRFHSRGMSMNFGKYEYENNKMMGANFMAGYNKALDIPGLKDFFFLRVFFVLKYRVWSGNIRYTYGSSAPTDLQFIGNGTYPQSLGISVNKQHQFQNPHFVLDNNISFNYFNTLKKYSIGYTPQLFYFTDNGWRFYVQPGYYFSSSKAVNQRRSISKTQEENSEPKPARAHSFLINAGVRKEFGIPLFWRKEKFPTIKFLAFIDHNGNNKQDGGEISLENVVVKFGEWESLTNEKGMVTFSNVFGDSTYSLSAFSLVDLKGYFSNIPLTIAAVKDSTMFIPFVKGIKIHGNAYLDREKITPGIEKPLDLTGIKISALNGKITNTLTDGKGDFSFYVPFGKYTITMDEKVLGDRFTLLQNNFELELDQKTESIFLTFYIVERRRKITVKKFNGNGDRLKEADTTLTPKPKTIEELKNEEKLKKQNENLSPGIPGEDGKKEGEKGKREEKGKKGEKGKAGKGKTESSIAPSGEPIDKKQIKFKVQIGAYGSDVPNEVVEKIKSIPDIKESRTEEGLMRYTAGEFSDYESAQALRQELINKGISSDTTFVIIIADYKGRVFSAEEAKELLKY